MTARTWSYGDPEPADHPPLVDKDGVTWDDTDELDIPTYTRLVLIHRPELPGVVVGGPVGLAWDEITEEYGPLREATTGEAETITELWPAGRRAG